MLFFMEQIYLCPLLVSLCPAMFVWQSVRVLYYAQASRYLSVRLSVRLCGEDCLFIRMLYYEQASRYLFVLFVYIILISCFSKLTYLFADSYSPRCPAGKNVMACLLLFVSYRNFVSVCQVLHRRAGVCLCVCMSICWSVRLCVHELIPLSVGLAVCLCVSCTQMSGFEKKMCKFYFVLRFQVNMRCQPVYAMLFVDLFICLFIRLFICMSVCQSVCVASAFLCFIMSGRVYLNSFVRLSMCCSC